MYTAVHESADSVDAASVDSGGGPSASTAGSLGPSVSTGDDPFQVLPDISGVYFTCFSIYMAVVMTFGITSNLAVIVAYWRVRSVSQQN